MIAKPLYLIIKAWVWLSLRLFYRDIQISGKANLPKDQPIIFISNHFNTLIDPLLIVTAIRQKVWFLTRSDVFGNKLLAKVLHFLGAIPVYRPSDGFKAPLKNQETYKFCQSMLNQNGCIALFPEGTHLQHRTVRAFKKGILRIWQENPQAVVVPVGLNFSTLNKSYSKIGIHFGERIVYHPNVATQELKTALEKQLFLCQNFESQDAILDIPWSRNHVNQLTQPGSATDNWQALQNYFNGFPDFILPFKTWQYVKNMVVVTACLPLTLMGLISEIPFRIVLHFLLNKFKDSQFHIAIHWFLKHLWVSSLSVYALVAWLNQGLFSGTALFTICVLLGLLVLLLFKRNLRQLEAQVKFILLTKEQQNHFLKAFNTAVNQ